MKKMLIILFIGVPYFIFSQTIQESFELKDKYLGQALPGLIPEVFAPGIVSDSSWAEHCQVAISPKGDEIYWSAWSSKYPPADTTYGHYTEQIYYSKIEKGKWTKPALAEFTKDHLTNLNGGPVFSLDGNRLYFYSVDRLGGLGGMDTWYVERIDRKWSKPINVGEPYNTTGADWSPNFTALGNAYKHGGKTKKYKFENGEFSNPDTIVIYEGFKITFQIFVSPDESFVIFDSSVEGGYGNLDLYISFKDENDSWAYPINMGNKINSERKERFPVVSPDGKFMFFVRHTPGQDFFWVSTEIIEELKRQ